MTMRSGRPIGIAIPAVTGVGARDGPCRDGWGALGGPGCSSSGADRRWGGRPVREIAQEGARTATSGTSCREPSTGCRERVGDHGARPPRPRLLPASRGCREIVAPRDPSPDLSPVARLAEPHAAARPGGRLEVADRTATDRRPHRPERAGVDHGRKRRRGPLLPPDGRRVAGAAEVADLSTRLRPANVRRRPAAHLARLGDRGLERQKPPGIGMCTADVLLHTCCTGCSTLCSTLRSGRRGLRYRIRFRFFVITFRLYSRSGGSTSGRVVRARALLLPALRSAVHSPRDLAGTISLSGNSLIPAVFDLCCRVCCR